jgi:FAD/FMN-containing dehydrogenase
MTSPVDSLQDIVRGRVSLPGEPGWDEARAAWNLSADQRPAAVVEAADADDIAAVLRAGCRVAPQATGHGADALGPLDETVLLKTSGLRGVSVDLGARVARVEAGVRAADAAASSASGSFYACMPRQATNRSGRTGTAPSGQPRGCAPTVSAGRAGRRRR